MIISSCNIILNKIHLLTWIIIETSLNINYVYNFLTFLMYIFYYVNNLQIILYIIMKMMKKDVMLNIQMSCARNNCIIFISRFNQQNGSLKT